MDNKVTNRFNLGDAVWWFDNIYSNDGIRLKSGEVTKIEYNGGYFLRKNSVALTIDHSITINEEDCFDSKEDACTTMIDKLEQMMVQR